VPDTIGIKALYAIGLALLLFLVVRPALKWLLDRRFEPGRPLDEDLFALLLFGALASGLAADRIGIHALNGGFLFGACVPQIEGLGRAVIDRMQQFVVVFLIPIFLAVSGLQTDLTVLKGEHIAGILLFLAAMIVGKWGVGALAGRAVGLKWNEANAIGVLMNCRGLMILVVALIGKQAGVITDPMQIAFVLGAIVTTLMTGPLVDVFLPREEVEAERDKSIAGSLAELPAMTGGPRVLVVPGDPALVAPVLAAADRHGARDGPQAQFLVVDLPGLAMDSDYVGSVVDEDGSGPRRALGWAQPAAERLAAATGSDAEAVSFMSPDPAADLAKLATDWGATHAIVTREEDAAALEAAGIEVERVGAPERAGT
jgi:hypothetical protein